MYLYSCCLECLSKKLEKYYKLKSITEYIMKIHIVLICNYSKGSKRKRDYEEKSNSNSSNSIKNENNYQECIMKILVMREIAIKIKYYEKMIENVKSAMLNMINC